MLFHSLKEKNPDSLCKLSKSRIDTVISKWRRNVIMLSNVIYYSWKVTEDREYSVPSTNFIASWIWLPINTCKWVITGNSLDFDSVQIQHYTIIVGNWWLCRKQVSLKKCFLWKAFGILPTPAIPISPMLMLAVVFNTDVAMGHDQRSLLEP